MNKQKKTVIIDVFLISCFPFSIFKVGLPFINRSAWKYALYIDLEKPEGAKKTTEEPTQQYSSAVQMAFSLARYRVIQRSVMVRRIAE